MRIEGQTNTQLNCCILSEIQLGIVGAVALGTIAAVGHYVLHWGNIPVIACGGSSCGILFLSGCISSVRRCGNTSHRSAVNEKEDQTLKAEGKPFLERVGLQRVSPQKAAECIFQAMQDGNIETFKARILRYQDQLDDILDQSIQSEAHVQQPLRYYLADSAPFLSAFNEITQNISMSIGNKRQFQTCELHEFMKKQDVASFERKIKVYSEEDMNEIAKRPIRGGSIDRDIYNHLQQIEQSGVSNIFPYSIFAIALAYQETQPQFFNILLQHIQTISRETCSSSVLIHLWRSPALSDISKIEESFAKEIAQKAAEKGAIDWARTFYDKISLDTFIRNVFYSNLTSEKKMDLIHLIPLEQFIDYKEALGDTILHWVFTLHEQKDLVFIDLLCQYCSKKCPDLFNKQNEKTQRTVLETLNKESLVSLRTEKIEILKKYTTI